MREQSGAAAGARGQEQGVGQGSGLDVRTATGGEAADSLEATQEEYAAAGPVLGMPWSGPPTPSGRSSQPAASVSAAARVLRPYPTSTSAAAHFRGPHSHSSAIPPGITTPEAAAQYLATLKEQRQQMSRVSRPLTSPGGGRVGSQGLLPTATARVLSLAAHSPLHSPSVSRSPSGTPLAHARGSALGQDAYVHLLEARTWELEREVKRLASQLAPGRKHQVACPLPSPPPLASLAPAAPLRHSPSHLCTRARAVPGPTSTSASCLPAAPAASTVPGTAFMAVLVTEEDQRGTNNGPARTLSLACASMKRVGLLSLLLLFVDARQRRERLQLLLRERRGRAQGSPPATAMAHLRSLLVPAGLERQRPKPRATASGGIPTPKRTQRSYGH